MTPRGTRSAGMFAALFALGMLTAAVSLAKISPNGLQHQITQIPSRTPEDVRLSGQVAFGVESGVARSIHNVNFPVTPSDPETMARQYLSANVSKLSLGDPLLGDLFVRATRKGVANTVVRFEQRVQGIPVLAPDVVVTIDNTNKVTFVMNGYETGISIASVTPAVTEAAAIGHVSTELGISAAPAYEHARLVIVPDGKASILAYEVRTIPSTAPHGEWRALIDAQTGEMISLEDISFHATGSGFVFDPDPLGTAHATYGQPGYTDAADATSAQLDAARSTRNLLDITDIGGGVFKLQGPFATIVDTEAPLNGLFTQPSTTFNFDRTADAFEAVNCYFHIDHIMRYVNNTLGVGVTPYQYAGGARFDPHGLSGDDNSHYTSGNGVVAFGEGGVDDAEDADVVIHELGHGLHDWLTAGGLSQVNGLSEGIGDYVCQSYSRSLNQWTSAEAPFHWTFSWDGHNEWWAGRITNSTALYPGGLVGQVHADGQIWATCLMRIWNQIGREQTDRALFEGLTMTNSTTNQNQAAQAVLQAAISMGYPGSEIAIMVNEFRATGYTVSVGIDYVSSSFADECGGNPGNVNGILEPGEGAVISVSLVASSLPHTGVTGVLTSTTPGITIVDGVASWPNLAPGVPASSIAPHFRILVSPSVPCLSTANFQLSVTSNEGGPFISNFTRPIGSSLTPTGLPLPIPDSSPAGATSTLSISSPLAVSDVNVRVKITHTWVGDVVIKLKSPLGTEVTLLDRPGVPASTFGCSNDNMDVTFDDAGASTLEAHCAGTNPWFTGVAKPVSLLSAFNGEALQGNWVLTVSDLAGGDLGTLTSWELITTPAVFGTCNVCDNVVATRLAYFVAEDKADGIEVAWEFADRSDVESIALERAPAQVGPWETVDAEYANDGSRTAVLDRSVRTDETYFYRLRVVERDGRVNTLDLIAARHSMGAVRSTMLLGASPNPAPATTNLAFRLSQQQPVYLSVVDAQGRRVRTLFEGTLQAGDHARFWDGADDHGKPAPAGLYFGVMVTGEGRQSSRFVLMR